MKNAKKALSLVLVIATLFLALSLTACKEAPLVIKDSDTFIVIKTTEKSLEGKDGMMLIDYMAELRNDGKLEFAVTDGMVTSINGQANAADYSICWMLYTSDADFASSAWGTVEYEGVEYGSAVVGAETLELKPDQIYIWVFKSF